MRLLIALVLLTQTPQRQQQTGVVTGILRTDQGTPLIGVRVALTPVEDSPADTVLESLSRTDGEGRYRLDGVLPGRYHIAVGRVGAMQLHPGVTDRQLATTVVVSADATSQAPDMIFKRTRVSGKVIDAATGTGRGIERLLVCCPDLDDSTSEILLARSSTPATVKGDGSFMFALPHGTYSIHAGDPQIVPVTQLLTVGDQDIDGLEVKVSSGVDVEGSVSDSLGMPMSGVWVRLTTKPSNTQFFSNLSSGRTVMFSLRIGGQVSPPANDDRLPLFNVMTQYTAQTEPSGRFSIKRILPGAYILEVVAEGGYAEKRDIEVPPSGSVNVRFEIPLTRIEGRVVTTAGLRPPVEGTLRVISKEPDGPVLYVYPNAEGRFSVSIKAGSYRISTEFLGAPVRSIRDESKDLEGGVFTFDGKQKPNLIIVVEP